MQVTHRKVYKVLQLVQMQGYQIKAVNVLLLVGMLEMQHKEHMPLRLGQVVGKHLKDFMR